MHVCILSTCMWVHTFRYICKAVLPCVVYETAIMMGKRDSEILLYMVLAVEFLTSLDRGLPALEEVSICMYVCMYAF
jgi:hypothetical protein